MKVRDILNQLSEFDEDKEMDVYEIKNILNRAELGDYEGTVLRVYYSMDIDVSDEVTNCADDDRRNDFIKAIHTKDVDFIDGECLEHFDYLEFNHVDVIKNDQIITTF